MNDLIERLRMVAPENSEQREAIAEAIEILTAQEQRIEELEQIAADHLLDRLSGR